MEGISEQDLAAAVLLFSNEVRTLIYSNEFRTKVENLLGAEKTNLVMLKLFESFDEVIEDSNL